MKIFRKITAQQLLILILSSSTIIKLIYVFFLTQYHSYLVSDMGGYWDRALEFYGGNSTSLNQWVVWPPLYHYFIAATFKIPDLLGLSGYRLDFLLLIHILLSSLSVYVLFLIVKKITSKNSISLVAAGLYAFSFPLIYLNAFVLSENLSTPLTIFSIWFLIKGDRKRDVIISALLLSISVGIRPVNGLFGLVFFLYIIFSNKKFKENFIKAILFSFFFFIVIGLIVINNYNISGGKISGLSGNGGLNFYFAQSKTYGVKSWFDNYYYVIVPPINVNST